MRRVIFSPMLSCYENFLISVTIEVFAEIRVFSFESHSHHLCASSSWIWRRSLLIFSFLKCNFAEHDSTLGPWTAPPSAFSSTLLLKQKPQFILLLPSSSSTPNQLPNPTDSTSLKFTHLSFIITKLFQIPHFLTANLCFGWSSNSRLSHTSQLKRPLNCWIPAFFSSFFLSKNYPLCLFKLKTKPKQKRNQKLSQESNCALDSQRSRETGHFHLSFPEY